MSHDVIDVGRERAASLRPTAATEGLVLQDLQAQAVPAHGLGPAVGLDVGRAAVDPQGMLGTAPVGNQDAAAGLGAELHRTPRQPPMTIQAVPDQRASTWNVPPPVMTAPGVFVVLSVMLIS